jgi:hypothetical protein
VGRRRNKQKHAARSARKEPDIPTMDIDTSERKPGEVPIPYHKWNSAFVTVPPASSGAVARVGCMENSYMMHLFVGRTDELVKDPRNGSATIVYKGDLFNEIMHELDSSWPYTGRGFNVRPKIRRDPNRNTKANVEAAEWSNPALWPMTIHMLAGQLDMTCNIVMMRVTNT